MRLIMLASSTLITVVGKRLSGRQAIKLAFQSWVRRENDYSHFTLIDYMTDDAGGTPTLDRGRCALIPDPTSPLDPSYTTLSVPLTWAS